jgi:carbon-monoxide dehydrogenase medium subunit
MIGREFRFFAPTELQQALQLLAELGEDARPLAGGMTLVPLMTLGLAQPEAIVSLNHLKGMDGVRDGGDCLRIGAMTRHATVERDPLVRLHCPPLAQAAACVGDRQVRHRGTLGGSLAHADPAADYPPVMLACGARMRLRGVAGERVVAAGDYFTGLFCTELQPGELLSEIEVPKIPPDHAHSYLRLQRVEGSFPIVNVAALLTPDLSVARLALGGVGSTAVMVDVAPDLAGGMKREALERAGEKAYAAAQAATDDMNGSAQYRRAMARLYAQRAIEQALARRS